MTAPEPPAPESFRFAVWALAAIVIASALAFGLVMATGGPNPGSGM